MSVSHFRVGFLKKHIPLKLLVGMDSLLQYTGGLIQISPSVFSRCRASAEKDAADPNSLFVCPKCKASLQGFGEDLECEKCGAIWPYKDGIYDFRIGRSE